MPTVGRANLNQKVLSKNPSAQVRVVIEFSLLVDFVVDVFDAVDEA
jgi:hypothetical protein